MEKIEYKKSLFMDFLDSVNSEELNQMIKEVEAMGLDDTPLSEYLDAFEGQFSFLSNPCDEPFILETATVPSYVAPSESSTYIPSAGNTQYAMAA